MTFVARPIDSYHGQGHWIEDSAHAWLAVPHADVVASGVAISECSYTNGVWAFLEEDCDAPAYAEAAYPDNPYALYDYPRYSCQRADDIRALPRWPELQR